MRIRRAASAARAVSCAVPPRKQAALAHDIAGAAMRDRLLRPGLDVEAARDDHVKPLERRAPGKERLALGHVHPLQIGREMRAHLARQRIERGLRAERVDQGGGRSGVVALIAGPFSG